MAIDLKFSFISSYDRNGVFYFCRNNNWGAFIRACFHKQLFTEIELQRALESR